MNKHSYEIIREFNCYGKHMIIVRVGNVVHVMDYSDWQLMYEHNHKRKRKKKRLIEMVLY